MKLNVSLLGFENVGAAAPAAVSPGQRTLRDMMWLEKDAALSRTTAKTTDSPPAQSPSTSGNGGSGKLSAGAKAVAPSPIAHAIAGFPSPPRPGMIAPSIANQATGLPATGKPPDSGSSVGAPRYVAEEGSVLVRCPRCKACLPVGEAWDAHREEHLSTDVSPDNQEHAGIQSKHSMPATACRQAASSSPPPHLSLSPRPSRSSLGAEGAAPGARAAAAGRNMGHVAGDFGFGDGDPPPPLNSAREAEAARGIARGSSGSGGGLRKSWKLSDLLMVAVMPEQAADVLRERGFLRHDGQTRFANLGLVGDDASPGEQQRTALDE